VRIQCEGGDSNLHGSYPASTSTAGPDDAGNATVPETPPDPGPGSAPTIPLDFPTLDELAVEILDARERREPIDRESARAFVHAVIAESDLGPLALDVLRAIDGDHPTAGRSLVALARAVRWSRG